MSERDDDLMGGVVEGNTLGRVAHRNDRSDRMGRNRRRRLRFCRRSRGSRLVVAGAATREGHRHPCSEQHHDDALPESRVTHHIQT
jgi:hypothetical protein